MQHVQMTSDRREMVHTWEGHEVMYHVYHLMSFELLVMKVDLVTGRERSQVVMSFSKPTVER